MQARNGIIHLACTFYLFSEVYRNHHFNYTYIAKYCIKILKSNNEK